MITVEKQIRKVWSAIRLAGRRILGRYNRRVEGANGIERRNRTMRRGARSVVVVIAVIAVIAGSAGAAAPAAAPAPAGPARVRVESGLLAGVEQDGVLVFKGVPYAAPPVGPWRWRPPQPPVRWTGERSAAAAGASCMQPVDPAGGGAVSEDCLTLELFVPKVAAKAPVMVWLHGGGNVQGAGSKAAYDGSAFARDGVLLVAINYRLGPLGFFAHPALTRLAAPEEPLASYGVMDQIAALQWVRRNIAAFGGDPGNVTLFGESAGGQDVLVLLAAPAARGLFAKAIAESPGHGWEPLPALAAVEAEGERAAVKAGLAAGATAAQLRAIPAERLVHDMGEGYEPAVDGRLLSESPAQAFARGHAADVPLILGSNGYEASLEPAAGVPPGVTAEMRAAYSGDTATDQQLGAALFADRFFTAPVRWFARQAAGGAPSWLYRFSYVRPSQRSKVPGAPHGSEIPYVFDSWDKLSPMSSLLPAEARTMTALVHSCWVSFARTGVPVCQGAPAWPAYTRERDQLLELGLPTGPSTEVRQHFRKPQLDIQERAAAKVLPGGSAP
jgi:para-nitrobenzyl esterase